MILQKSFQYSDMLLKKINIIIIMLKNSIYLK